MSNLTTTNVWPSTLPLPAVDYTGGARPPTIVSTSSAADFKRRRRWTQTYAELTVRWKFTRAEYTAFRTFWETTLNLGASSFEIELRYPKATALDEWVVKFLSDLSIVTEDNSIIEVSATIQTLNLKALADKAAALETFFLVSGVSSSAAPAEEFLVQVGGSAGLGTENFVVL